MTSKVSCAGIVMLALASVGCVSNNMNTRLDDSRFLPEDTAILAVQVVSNRGELAPNLERWTQLRVVDIDEPGAVYALHKLMVGIDDGDLFAGALPPGRYRLNQLISYKVESETIFELTATLPDFLSTFTLEPHRFTSLGTLVFQPLGPFEEADNAGNYSFTIVPVNEQNTFDEAVMEVHPPLAELVDTEFLLSWDEQPEVTTPIERSIRNHVVPGHGIRLSDGTPVIPSKLGQIYWFEQTAGVWRRADTGVAQKIEHVSKIPGGLLAVGERGMLLFSESWESPWRALPGPGIRHQITWAYVDPLAEYTYILTRTFNHIYLLRSHADSNRWEEIFGFKVDFDLRFSGRRIAFAYVEADKLILLADSRRNEFDLNGTPQESDRSRRFIDIARQINGVLVMDGPPGSGSLPRYSHDGGLNWIIPGSNSEEESVVSGQGQMLHVDDEGNEWMVADRAETKGTIWFRKVFLDTPRLRRMSSDGRSIDWFGLMPTGCVQIDPGLTSTEEFFVRCTDGVLMSSGSTIDEWTVELPAVIPSGDIESLDADHIGSARYKTAYDPAVIATFPLIPVF